MTMMPKKGQGGFLVTIIGLWILTTSVSSFSNSPFAFGLKRGPKPATCIMAEKLTTANIFEDYSKPIVLIGASSKNGELNKLAESITSLFSSEVLPPSDISASNIKDYGPVDVVVLDFCQQDYSEIAKSLYEDSKILSIYVNVHQQMDELEDTVFLPYSDYELCIRDEAPSQDEEDDNDKWEHIEWEMNRLIARALLPAPIPGDKTRTENCAHLTMGTNMFYLSLTFPKIEEVEPYVEDMCTDVDAMEYRVDLLDCQDSRFDLIYGQQLLRKYCRPHAIRVGGLSAGPIVLEDVMPTVYTVRTVGEGGKYPNGEEDITKMFEVLEWGLRAGVEVLDVEADWDEERTGQLLDLAEKRYSTQILGSHHVIGEQVSLDTAIELFLQCMMNGRAHGAKLVLTINSDDDDRLAYEAGLIAASISETEGRPVVPTIALALGIEGQFSRALNLPFTPVTHESMPFPAAPGQMTSNQIMMMRILFKIYNTKVFSILGHNIGYSVSPQMHRAGFEAQRLPNEYARADKKTVEEFVESEFFQGDNFGGSSVTIPHKQAIIPHVDTMSESAKAIGSVNTLVVREDFTEDEEFVRVIYGDNTDWKGIYNPIRRILSGKTGYALILGAGGTARAAAYAADKMGLDRLYFNRTPQKAAELAETFGGTMVSSLDEDDNLGETLKGDKKLRVVISTLPAAAEFELPDWLVQMEPLVFDVNYKPYYTKLLQQAEDAGLRFVRGSEMLWEQGVGQYELWMGRRAPYKKMKDAVLQSCLPGNESEEDIIVDAEVMSEEKGDTVLNEKEPVKEDI